MLHRKTAPKVKNGLVQKKNNWNETPNYWNTNLNTLFIDKEPPGEGSKHFLRKKDVISFISILPDWEELSKGLNAIILARSDGGTEGWINSGVIALCAWPRKMWKSYDPQHYLEHKSTLNRLGVRCIKNGNQYECQFTESQIRGYLLLHILLHELGHHHDRMSTKNKNFISRGESYAENYALKYENQIWDAYLKKFEI